MTQRTVVITGGNRGIGLGITEVFVEAGYRVVVGAREEAGLGARFGSRVTFVPCDVRNEADHHELVKRARDSGGTFDVYVNNAGFSAWRPIGEIDEPFLDELLGTNLKGVFWGCKAAAAGMDRGGCIINISSLAGKRGTPNNSAYCASKFGVNGVTQALAKELGPRGIRVNALCPVLIATDGLIEALRGPYAPAKSDPEGFIARFAEEQSALKRLPTSAEVGAMCVMLASATASAITGQCINVDCGVLPT
jgi:3-oxoacyl-[acyl-carrier protein] reductase/meso-butanediol dehydrogenase/(S,S)-butanediol dehydrogenase/diacetyl reductase